MVTRIFAALLIMCATAGCSVYDVAAISADLAVELFTDVNEGKSDQDHDPNNDPIRFWNPETSRCIYVETKTRNLDHGLDSMFDRFEEGKDHVVLPTGEKYPVGRHAERIEPELGPTRECQKRESDS
ncbi:MAG: hypothetical protein OER91_10875 [Gammaproteobacteria bacterium]|nr:hypothetical protein [Gammaproteobacteria bacterium]